MFKGDRIRVSITPLLEKTEKVTTAVCENEPMTVVDAKKQNDRGIKGVRSAEQYRYEEQKV